jgi:DNA-binding MarR family transcriptional regulator
MKQNPMIADLAALYMDVVPKAMREFRKEMRGSRAPCLSVPQFRILAFLNAFSTANNRTLAEHQGVSVAAMSRMIDWLCRKGLVERFADRNDRRQVCLRLTGKGAGNFKKFRQEAQRRLQARLANLSADQQQRLNNGLAALAKAVEHMGEPG